ncbi:MAG: DUF2946 family protein [Burkholderiaceae bacterium]|jgi:hypothetical protein|nr:DUF2946 family protein [Burkholderiaceae bacterium]
MDDIVKQALAKWPHVPHCYGWLGLDGRGQWYMRDDRTQALGAFASGVPQARGSLLRHDKLIGFIQRNYEADADGQWYFQNGPQRVYVELEFTPWIWRVASDGGVAAHTGQPVQARELLTDEAGRVYLLTDLGFGLVHTQDVGLVADAVEQGRWQPRRTRAAELPSRFGFVLSPQARYGGRALEPGNGS